MSPRTHKRHTSSSVWLWSKLRQTIIYMTICMYTLCTHVKPGCTVKFWNGSFIRLAMQVDFFLYYLKRLSWYLPTGVAIFFSVNTRIHINDIIISIKKETNMIIVALWKNISIDVKYTFSFIVRWPDTRHFGLNSICVFFLCFISFCFSCCLLLNVFISRIELHM